MTSTTRQERLYTLSLAAALGVILAACADGTESALPSESAMPAPAFITPVTRNATTAATSVKIAAGGKSLMPIVVSPDATNALYDAAADLARVLGKMTGAKFEIRTGDGTAGLVIGTAKQFPHPELDPELKAYVAADDREAFAIRTSPGRILLLGATDRGAAAAVYRFLDELGCRWLSPAANWEIIPSIPKLGWGKDITDRPDIPGRRIWYAIASKENRESYERWRARNNHNSGLTVSAGHAWYQVIVNNRAAFAAHPEYWPLIAGARATNLPTFAAQPDVGNPEVRKLFVEHALATLRKDRELARAKGRPEADMVSLEPNDGGAFSGSPEFKALGTISDAVFGMANEAARAVAREFPGKMVGMLAYREHADPPSFKLEPNVYVQITPAIFSTHSRDELVSMWARKSSNLGFYEYYMPYEWSLDQLPGGNASSLRFLSTSIRRAVSRNASSIDGQGSGCWFLNGMGYCLASRLMWNASLDVESLKTDYLRSAYGPAADTMRRFYALWDPDRAPIVSKNLVYEMALAVQEADRQANGRNCAEIRARIGDIKQYLRFLQLDWTLQSMGKDGPYQAREDAFVALLKHIMRSRDSHMNEVELAQQNLFQQRGEKSGLILVDRKPKAMINTNLLVSARNNPWKVTTPYTPEEIVANFQSTLDYFKSDPIEERTFSRDLVPIRWQGGQAPGVDDARETLMKVQSSVMLWAVYSFGEPIRVRVEPGAVYSAYKPRPWTLADLSGTVVAQGGVGPSDPDEKKSLEIPVPKAGVYFFEISDVGGGFLGLRFPCDTPASYVLARGRGINDQGPVHYMQPRCFYVPKGTRALQFFSGGTPQNPTKLYGPDGKILASAGGFREWTSIPVPAGMDGKVWRMDALLKTLWLAGVPQYVAASPARLLVPREIAEKDGLEIRRQEESIVKTGNAHANGQE